MSTRTNIIRALSLLIILATALFGSNVHISLGQEAATQAADPRGPILPRPVVKPAAPARIDKAARSTADQSSSALPYVAPMSDGGPAVVGPGYRSIHYETSVSSGLTFPFFISVDNDFYIVSDVLGDQVLMYQLTAGGGVYIRTFGSGTGAGAGQFNGPEQSAVVGNDVYIADYSNNRVQRFNKTTGAYISQFGSPGSGPGQFSFPTGLVYNPVNGLLYVSEQGNDRIQTFNLSGVYQSTFSGLGAGNGQVSNPWGMAVDSLGYIYVADSGNNRVDKFTAGGSWVRNIAVGVVSPLSVAVDRANVVWVPSGSGDLYAYDWQGGYHTYYYGSLAINAAGYFTTIRGIAVTPPINASPFNGTPAIIVSDGDNQTVQVFSVSAQRTSHPFVRSITSGLGSYIGGAAFDSSENVYITNSNSNQVRKYDRFGNFLTSWGGLGTGNGQFSFPQGIAVDDSNNVYVCDRNNDRIEKFSSTGVYLGQWGTTGSGAGQFNGPSAIAVDASWVYVTDEGNNRVQKFSPSGGYVRQWGSTGSANGQFSVPGGITVDRNRNQVYVSEYAGNRIQQFSVFGDFVKVFADSTSGTGALSNAVGLTTDQHGNIYVGDRGNSRVVHFSDNGTYLDNFASTNANGIGVDPRNGQIWVGTSSGSTLTNYGSNAGKADTIGIWRPSALSFYLRKSNTTGFADINSTVTFALSTDLPIVGDWNGDGITTVGVFRPSSAFFYLWDRNTNVSMATPDYLFTLGNPGDTPMSGDWDGDGKMSVGVYRPSNGILYLANKLATGFSNYAMVLGNPSDKGIGGDWNGDGQYSAGIFRPSNTTFYLSDKDTNGIVFSDYNVLLGNAGDTPFVGDWTQLGATRLGVYRPSNGFLYLKYQLTGIFADVGIFYGIAGDVGLGGAWGPVPSVAEPPPLGAAVQPHTVPPIIVTGPQTPAQPKSDNNGGLD